MTTLNIKSNINKVVLKSSLNNNKITTNINKVVLKSILEKKQLVTKFGAKQGPSGIPGKSAYQVALDNGFVGDEQAWLASLEVEGLFDNFPDDLLASYQIAKL